MAWAALAIPIVTSLLSSSKEGSGESAPPQPQGPSLADKIQSNFMQQPIQHTPFAQAQFLNSGPVGGGSRGYDG